jgi:hypothetical protein
MNCLPAHLQEGLIAFYPFTGGSLRDESPNSNDLTNQTSAHPSTDREGNSNCAYVFENTQNQNEFLTTTNSDYLNDLDEFSVSIWYEPIDTLRHPGKFEVLFSRGEQARCPDRRGEWSVGLYDCRRAVFGHNNSVWANTITGFLHGCEGEVKALSNHWHHVVAIKNGEAYKIFFDGNPQATQMGNGSCNQLHLAENIGDVFVGKYFTGKVDDILIYNRELTQIEITELYEALKCCQ